MTYNFACYTNGNSPNCPHNCCTAAGTWRVKIKKISEEFLNENTHPLLPAHLPKLFFWWEKSNSFNNNLFSCRVAVWLHPDICLLFPLCWSLCSHLTYFFLLWAFSPEMEAKKSQPEQQPQAWRKQFSVEILKNGLWLHPWLESNHQHRPSVPGNINNSENRNF